MRDSKDSILSGERASRSPSRFYTLDSVRGLAALGVIFYHWKHFPILKTPSETLNVQDLPFYSIFKIFYHQGFFAVELFFALSGFIFFWLYSDSIKGKKVLVKDFFVRRIARLYPLHIITLGAVLILQAIFFMQEKDSFIYHFNDTYHFILNLLLASSWGLQEGNSFNGVSWSISVEFLLYITFFFSCKYFGIKLRHILIWIMIGVCLRGVNPPIGQGISSFYIGGAVHLAYQKINFLSPDTQRKIKCSLGVLVGGAWTLILLESQYGFSGLFLTKNIPIHTALLGKIHTASTVLILFPLSILMLTLCEKKLYPITKRLSFLGDISYSLYLIHFPVQLLFVICFNFFGVNSIVFSNQYFQILFFLIVITLSYLSYYWIEIPAQKILRNKLTTVN